MSNNCLILTNLNENRTILFQPIEFGILCKRSKEQTTLQSVDFDSMDENKPLLDLWLERNSRFFSKLYWSMTISAFPLAFSCHLCPFEWRTTSLWVNMKKKRQRELYLWVLQTVRYLINRCLCDYFGRFLNYRWNRYFCSAILLEWNRKKERR